MKSRTLFFAFLFITIILVIFYSCKDMGTPPPAQTPFSASSTNVTVNKGAATQVTFSGGIAPYTIRVQADTVKAIGSLTASVLTISGIDTGSTMIVVSDNKTPVADSIEIMISVLRTSTFVLFSNTIQPIFTSQCGGGCHGSNGGLSLAVGSSYSNLVNVQAQSSCTSLKRVLPNDAANSVLFKKVSGNTCGTRMPEGSALTAGDIALIQDWINQGAKNN
jgi:hypothetical protein